MKLPVKWDIQLGQQEGLFMFNHLIYLLRAIHLSRSMCGTNPASNLLVNQDLF